MRVTRQGRWLKYPDLDWLQPNEIQSDALLDLQTKGNRLSVYKIEDAEDAKQIAIALASNRDYPDNLDYAVFDDTTLVSTGIAISQQDGDTPHYKVNELHYDVSNLTVERLTVLAHAISKGAHVRVLRKVIEAEIQEAMRAGVLDEDKMKPKLLQKIR